ncbi:hypothetical protein BC936DRAFT_148014 [Jimgerdemannia flammicorona]|uniref:Uncharacterized protein n=1 Tax=Jimgerdemannia flammicorona TaxID=994334 RepID=A0A433DKR9_9FUNG|nr:hypothetical protein BC936DRAFT_148014 [Jimgerdemannia flammicorona]
MSTIKTQNAVTSDVWLVNQHAIEEERETHHNTTTSPELKASALPIEKHKLANQPSPTDALIVSGSHSPEREGLFTTLKRKVRKVASFLDSDGEITVYRNPPPEPAATVPVTYATTPSPTIVPNPTMGVVYPQSAVYGQPGVVYAQPGMVYGQSMGTTYVYPTGIGSGYYGTGAYYGAGGYYGVGGYNGIGGYYGAGGYLMQPQYNSTTAPLAIYGGYGVNAGAIPIGLHADGTKKYPTTQYVSLLSDQWQSDIL